MRAEYLDKSIGEKEELTSNGAPYSVYTLLISEPLPEKVGSLSFGKARSLVATMKSETSVVLELAATIHWLKEKEKVADWKTELKTRKPTKATSELTGRAEQLLNRIQAEAGS